jgi:hypothetical protein
MILMPSDLKKARILTVVACTITALACGSNVCPPARSSHENWH